MDSYEIRWKNSAEHDLRRIGLKEIPRILKAVESLVDNPFPPQHRKLRGSERDYRIRVGDYRVIYQVETRTKIITIYYVRHRREAYGKQ
jgi:mRNA interferase RelE/StbE